MKTALFILTVYILGESLAVHMADNIFYEGNKDMCPCCLPPCCCKCAKRETQVTKCNNTLDICFVVDSSASIGTDNWEVVKQFIINVTRGFTIGESETRVGLITYSVNASKNWNLAGLLARNRIALESAIMNIELMGGELTNTVEAMELAMEEVFGQTGDRNDTPNAFVLMTDGTSTNHMNEVVESALRLQEVALVTATGVTNKINETELSVIATGDNMTNVFTVDNFNDLSQILPGLVKTLCQNQSESISVKVDEQCICCCPPMTFGYGWGGGCGCKEKYDEGFSEIQITFD